MIRKSIPSVLTVTLLVVAAGPTPTRAHAAQTVRPAGDALIEPMPGPAPRAASAALAAPGSRIGIVRVRPGALPRVGRATLTVAPFAGTELEVEIEPATDPNEGRIWVGRIAGDPAGSVHLRRERGGLAGTLRHRDGIVQLVASGGRRSLALLVPGAMPAPDRVLPLPERLRRASLSRRPAPMSMPGVTSTIDLIVMLERRAIVELRGTGGYLKSAVRSGVVDLNQALASSGVDAEVRLLKIKRDRFGEDGDDLAYASRLLQAASNPDGDTMKKSTRLRERFGADVVAVIMARNTGVCGLAWLAGSRDGVEAGDADGAFSVTAWRCLPSGTLAHEIGHNMGAQHFRLDPTSNRLGAYDYSYGHRETGHFHTVMAYRCEFCTPLLNFSNPDVSVDGRATGVATGPEQAANAWGFERDREVIASFRECRRDC